MGASPLKETHMSETAKLVATARETFGKGVARKLRAAGQTPVVVYGHGADPVHLSVETHPLTLIVRHANALIELDIEGKKQLVLVKDVQKNPLLQAIEHVDLLLVNKGEKVSVEVNIVVIGEPAPATMHVVERQTLEISADASDLPESLEVDITGLEAGAVVRAQDVTLPAGAELLTDPESDIVLVSEVRTEAADAAAETTEA